MQYYGLPGLYMNQIENVAR